MLNEIETAEVMAQIDALEEKLQEVGERFQEHKIQWGEYLKLSNYYNLEIMTLNGSIEDEDDDIQRDTRRRTDRA